MNSLYDEVISNEAISNVPKKAISTVYSLSFFFLFESG